VGVSDLRLCGVMRNRRDRTQP